MLIRTVLFLLICTICSPSLAQFIPQRFQLRTDAITGSVAGGYFQSRTDPEPTIGSIYINPVTQPIIPALYTDQMASRVEAVQYQAEAAINKLEASGAAAETVAQLRETLESIRQTPSFGPRMFQTPIPDEFGFDAPFDATRGLRNYQTPLGAPEALMSGAESVAGLEAFAYQAGRGKKLFELFHQPLIQIKIRVIEVVRDDSFQANSILEYVSTDGSSNSLTSGLPANNMAENFRSISRFVQEGLTTSAANGAGLLLNLTSEHINAAVQLLANDFNADVVTAPQVVTLNGQNVEFVSGEKIPFQLGQNVIQGTNNNIQQFFYKNVGTYVSVTPKIVNWGFYGEGQGQASFVSGDVLNWNELAELLLDRQYFDVGPELGSQLTKYNLNRRPIPFATKQMMLDELNRLGRNEVLGTPIPPDRITGAHDGQAIIRDGTGIPGIERALNVDTIDDCNECDWKPSDCTIDLALVVRLSEAQQQTISTNTPDDISTNIEANVRAIANVIQIKSGQGIVMAGLIGEREADDTVKVPVLGDLPIVGAAFRSRATLRQKTEVLIFLEAEVLDPRPQEARCQSGEDFQLGQPYLGRNLKCNPLNRGFECVGFGQYLPPACCGEDVFWERNHRAAKRIKTHIGDFFSR